MGFYNNSSEFNVLSKCFFLPNPAFEKVPLRYTSNLITALINVAFAPFAVVSNSLLLLLLRRCPQLSNPSNILLGCLAFSDILVGLITQPSYAIFRLQENQFHFVSCSVRIVYSTSFYMCYGVSFMTLSAISCERYFALKLHLRYKELITKRRVCKVVALMWVIDVFLTTLQWSGFNVVARAVHLGLWTFCLVVACALQYKVYKIVKYHRLQILQQYRQFGQNFHRQTRLTTSLGYMVSVYILFNLPVLFITILHQVAKVHLENYDAYSWTETIAFLNSSLNPLICVWKRKDFRRCFLKLASKCCCVFTDSVKISGVQESRDSCIFYRHSDTSSNVKDVGTRSFAFSSTLYKYSNGNISQPNVIDVHL